MNCYRIKMVLAAVLIACSAARAEDWPTRLITLVVPYPAGGPTDVVGRLFAQQMSQFLGRSIVVENIVGAGGTTGASRVAHAAPAGYQVLFIGSAMTNSQLLYKKSPFDSLTDFSPVALLTRQSLVLIARNDAPFKDLPSFVRYLKEKPTASFGSAGAGSSTHLGCVMLNLAINANATHVPYRGVGPAMQDLIGGRIDYFCTLIPDAIPQIQGGAIKGIATLSGSRSQMLPQLPTAKEQGVANVDISDWYGLFLPKGAPASIVQKLHDAAVASLDTPAFRDRLHSLGVEDVAPDRRTPEYLARFLKDEIVKWTAPIKASGVTVD
jgi:tripartite-type tricarboxylate transporter receptor subunit TctC